MEETEGPPSTVAVVEASMGESAEIQKPNEMVVNS